MTPTKAIATTYISAAKLILNSTGPIQALIESLGLVHDVCNRQAIQILINDGLVQEGQLITNYLEQINAGTAWIDKGWKNMAHYLDPVTGQGVKGWPSAAEECAKYFMVARSAMDQQQSDQAFFYLGAAVHLVQDLCVPHHSRNIILSGHHRYENWAEEHVQDYLVISDGLYADQDQPAEEWVLANARSSYDLFALVNSKSEKDYDRATKLMLPRTQRTTAGFFKYFLSQSDDAY